MIDPCRRWPTIIALLYATLFENPCFSAISTLPLSGALDNLSAFLTKDIANTVITLVGVTFDHRPLEPASPLGTSLGLDLGVEVNVIQIPDSVKNKFSDKGINIGDLPVLPSLKFLNLHKGLGESVDIGGSILIYQSYLVWGAEIKVVLYNPEEGLTWAIRLGGTSVHVPIGSTNFMGVSINVSVDTFTLTPELVVSKRLNFFEPYLGVGYQYASGGLNISNSLGITIPGLSSVTGSGGSPLAFLGLSMKLPYIGLRLTLEGSGSIEGFNSIGTKVGFSF